jgi:hypothetical protein
MFTIKSLPSYIACHDSLDPLFQTLEIWIQGSGTAGHVSSVTYFSKLLEDKDRRLKIKLTLSLILWINLKLGDYSIWSACSIVHHIKEDLTTTRAWAPHSLDAAKEVLGRHLQDGAFKSTRKPAVLYYEELGGLSDPGTRDCARGVLFLG